jgi:hypothetical protein
MVEGGDGARFTLEALAKFRGGDFDRDYAVEPRIAGAVDFAHTSSADGTFDDVRA